MKLKKTTYLMFVAVLLTCFACKNSLQDQDFQVSETGTKYKFFVKNEDAKKVQGGYFIDFHLIQKNHKDSTVSDQNYVQPFPADSITGDPMLEAFRMMAIGDSAIFKLSTDTLLAQRKKAIQTRIDGMKTQMNLQMAQAANDSIKQGIERQWQAQIQVMEQQMNKPDPQLPPSEYITLIIKINNVSTEEEMRKAEEEKISKQKKIDDDIIVDYLKKNNLEAKSTASGLYYIIKKEGNGPVPVRGDMVSVDYVGKLLDGTVFDTSDEEVAKEGNVYREGRTYEPLKFPIGVQPMIKGWEEALFLLKEGTAAQIFIPSYLGYGAQGSAPSIAPNTVLTFDIELVSIEKNHRIRRINFKESWRQIVLSTIFTGELEVLIPGNFFSMNQRLYKLIRKDVFAFNDWRMQNQKEKIDLTDADFSGLDLSDAFLMDTILDGANFNESILQHTYFCGASLKGADFTQADLRVAYFGPPELVKADFLFTDIGKALHQAADLESAIFKMANLTGANLREANLTNADLTEANLSHANLKNARLEESQLENAILNGTTLPT